jgi:hypothetical protein
MTKIVSLYLDRSVISQIPIIYWVTVGLLYIALYNTSRIVNNKLEILILLLLFFFTLCSANLFFVSPYQQTDRSLFRYADILRYTNHIGLHEMVIDSYFEWPVFFAFLKTMDLVFGVSLNALITIGLFALFLMLPIFIIFYIDEEKYSNKKELLFIVPAIYILISYYFIIDQFAPQFFAILYLILLYGIYDRIKKMPYQILLIFIYTMLVFTHPLTWLYFVAPITLDYLYSIITKHHSLTSTIIALFITIYGAGFVYRFFSMTPLLRNLFKSFGFGIGETIHPIMSFLGNSSSTTYPLFNLVPKYYYIIFSSLSRLCIIFFIILFIMGIIQTRKKLSIEFMDIYIGITNVFLYIMGIFTTFLGQRSLQIISLPVSKIYGDLIKKSQIIYWCLGILICIVPTIFMITRLIDVSIDGGYFIQDEEMDAAGVFIDAICPSDYNVFFFANSYPTGYPANFQRYYTYKDLVDKKILNKVNIIVNSPKTKLTDKYTGMDVVDRIDRSNKSNIIYYNGYTSIVFKNWQNT